MQIQITDGYRCILESPLILRKNSGENGVRHCFKLLTHLILNGPLKKVEPVILIPIFQMRKLRLRGAGGGAACAKPGCEGVRLRDALLTLAFRPTVDFDSRQE